MRIRLLWKLLLINILPVICVIILIVWLAIDKLAANYFMALMENYEVSPKDIHRMFLSSIHYYLIWASLAALGLAFVLSYFLTRKVLKPLSQMTELTKEVAAGNFTLRAEISTGDEVGQLGSAFNSMADSLEHIEQLRKNMVADVAHELRTPLTNLRGYLEALNDGVLPPGPEIFKMLQKENLRLVNLVESLQQLAKADAARAYLKVEKVVISDLIDQMIELYIPNFEIKNISIQREYEDQNVAIPVDRDKLLQAIRNLIDNCWKYTPDHGLVSIRTKKQNQGVKVAFINSGVVISKDDLPFIFERFFRTDRSRSRDIGGAGLGLAITKELIEAHGGTVGVESSRDSTQIWLVLPNG